MKSAQKIHDLQRKLKDKDLVLKFTVFDLETVQRLVARIKRHYKLVYYSMHERKTLYSSFMTAEKRDKPEYSDLEYFNLGSQVSKLFKGENQQHLPLVLYNGIYDLMYVS